MEDSFQVPAGCVASCKSLDLSGLCFLLYKTEALIITPMVLSIDHMSLRTNGKCERPGKGSHHFLSLPEVTQLLGCTVGLEPWPPDPEGVALSSIFHESSFPAQRYP